MELVTVLVWVAGAGLPAGDSFSVRYQDIADT